MVEGSLDCWNFWNCEKCRVKNLLDIAWRRLILVGLFHFHMGIESYSKISVIFCLNKKDILTFFNFCEESSMIFIALNIIDSIISPFITVTTDVHVLFKSWVSNIFSEMASWHFLLIDYLLGKEISELRIRILWASSLFRYLNTHSKHSCVKYSNINPNRHSNLWFNIHAVLDEKVFRLACNSWSCITLIEISDGFFLVHKEISLKI